MSIDELADRIIRALDAAGDRHGDQTPDSGAIRARYAELKRAMDFDGAAFAARKEWLARTLAEAMAPRHPEGPEGGAR